MTLTMRHARRLCARLLTLAMLLALGSCSSEKDADPVPTRITDLEARSVNDSTIVLRWSAPSVGGGRVDDYDIRYAENEAHLDSTDLFVSRPFFDPPNEPGEEDTVRISGLERVTAYYFTVRGIAKGGHLGPASNTAQETTVADTIPPRAITDLRVVSRTDESLALEWTASGDDGGTGRVRRYMVAYEKGARDSVRLDMATVAHFAARFAAGAPEDRVISGLDPRTSYTISVQAEDEQGLRSQPSNFAIGLTDRSSQDWVVLADGSGDAPTIQAAVDSSRQGEWILVGPGTFVENISVTGRSVWIRGQGPELTTIDGRSFASSTISIRSVPDGMSRLELVRITGGVGARILVDNDTRGGGGVFCQAASITVRRCVLSENGDSQGSGVVRPLWGGGIYAERRDGLTTPDVVIEDSEVRNNVAHANGGGIGIAYGARATIRGCTISHNQTFQGDGGGIWILNTPSPATIASCFIFRNDAYDHGGGAYIGSGSHQSVRVVDSTFLDNLARQLDGVRTEDVGGGLWLHEVTGIVANCTLARNWAAVEDNERGGSIAIYDTPGLTLQRNIIALTVRGGGIYCGGQSRVFLVQNLYWMNAGGDVVQGSLTTNDDLAIYGDPMFCDIEGQDLGVPETSPAALDNGSYVGAMPPGTCPAAFRLSRIPK